MEKEIKIKKSFWATLFAVMLFVAIFAFIWAIPNNSKIQNNETQIVLAEGDAEVTVPPEAVTDLVFNGSAQTLITAGTATNGTMQYKVGVDGEYSTELPTATNAGTYTVYYKAVAEQGYNDSAEGSFQVTIAQKDVAVNVTANDQNTTYTGVPAVVTNGYTLSCAGLVGSDTVDVFNVTGDVSYAYSESNPTNAGSYTITPSGTLTITATNYNVTPSYNNGTLVIGKALLTVMANNMTVTYGDAVPTYTVGYNIFVNNETSAVLGGSLVFTCSYAQNDAVGTYTITPSGLTSDNYEITFQAGTLTVENADITNVSFVQTNTLVYDGDQKTATITPSATVVNNQSVTYTYCDTIDGTYTSSVPTFTPAGNHTVYYKANAANHNEKTGSFTITIAKAQIDAPTASLKTYVYDGEQKEYLPANWDELLGEFDELVEISGNQQINANESGYTVTVSLTDKDNYCWKDTQTSDDKEFLFVIHKADATLTAPTAKTGLYYTGSAQNLVNAGSAQGGQLQYKLNDGEYGTSVPAATAPGTYTVYYKVLGDANHNDIAEASFEVAIGKADLTLTVSMAAWTYGSAASDPSVSGNDGNGEVTYAYKVSGADDSTYTATKPTNAGTYTVKATVAETTNYSSATATTNFTIAKATYDMSGVSFANGEFTYDGNAKSLGISGTLPQGVQVNYTGNGQVNASATVYTVTAIFTGDADNYNAIADMTASLTINFATLTNVSVVQSEELTYTGSAQTATVNAQATAVNSQATSFTYSSDGTNYSENIPAFTNAGNYTVYYKVTAPNHNEATGNFTVTIAKANSVLVTEPTAISGLVYTGSAQALVTAGEATGGTIQFMQNNGQFTADIPTGIDAKAYMITYKVVGDENHNDINQSAFAVAITNATLTNVNVERDGTYTYNGQPQVINVTTTATAVNNQQVTFTYSETENGEYGEMPAFTNAGNHIVYYKATAPNHNEASGTVNAYIKKADSVLVTAPAGISGLVYTGSAQALVTAGEATGGTIWYTLDLENYSTDVPTGTNVKSYSVCYKVVGDENHNDINKQYIDGNVTISPATLTNVSVAQNGTLSYTGEPLTADVTTTATAVNNQPVTFTYSTSNEENAEYTDTVPAFTNVGNHTVYFKATAPNHSKYSGSFTVTIGKATYDMSGVSFANGEFTYDGNEKSLAISGTLPQGVTVSYTGNGQTNANETGYTVTAVFTGDAENYNEIANMTATLVIHKANATLTAPTGIANLVYTTKAQALVNAGSAQGGELQYKLNDGDYQTAVPTATNAGIYTVYFKVVGDANHNNIAEDSVQVTIARVKIDLPEAVEVEEPYTYTGNSQSLEIENIDDIEEFVTITNNEQTDADTYYVIFAINDKTNYCWQDNTDENKQLQFVIQPAQLDANVAQSGTLTYTGLELTTEVTTSATAVNNQPVTFTYAAAQDGEYGAMPTFVEAGEYTVYFKATAPNHDDATGSFVVTIGKATYDMSGVTFANGEFTYDGNAKSLQISGELPNGVEVDYTGNGQTNASNTAYVVTATFTGDADNYYPIDNMTAELTINPLEIEITWSENDFTYNGEEQTVTASYKDVNNQDVALKVEMSDTFQNFGEYTATASFVETDNTLGNYKLPQNATAIYNVKAYEVAITWCEDNYTYNGEEQTVTASYKNINGEDVALKVEMSDTFQNLGEYTATASFAETDNTLGNYKLPQNATETYNIKALEVVIAWSENDFTYNGEEQTVTASYKDVNDQDVALKVEMSDTFQNFGEYTATVSFADTDNTLGNYKLPQEVTKTYNIKALEIVIDWCENDFTYNEQEQIVTASYKDANDQDVALVVEMDNSFQNAGEYTATANFADTDNTLGNYKLPEEATATYNIKAYVIEIVWSENNFTYNGEEQTVTASYKNANNQDIELAVTMSDTFKNVGEYTATARFNELDNVLQNYSLPQDNTNTYNIKALEVVIAWSENNFTYNGEEQTVTASYQDVDGQDVELAVTMSDTFKNVGEYTATANFVDGDNEYGNYKLPAVSTSVYNINAIEVQITWSENNFTYNGEEQVIIATYKDIDDEDVELKVTTDKAFKNFGDYIATASFADNDNEYGNYKLPAENTNVYSINAFEVEIIWSEDNYTYNGSEQIVTAKYMGKDSQNPVSLKVTMNKEFKNVANDYVATASFVDNGNPYNNYLLPDVVTNNYSIKPVEVTINWQADDFTYTGLVQTITASYTHLTNIVPLKVEVDREFKNAGEYTATASFAVTDNFSENYVLPQVVTKSYTIKKAELDVIVEDATFILGESIPTFSFTVVGHDESDALVNQIKENSSYVVDGSLDKPGICKIKLVCNQNMFDNYEIQLTDGNFTIVQKEINDDKSGISVAIEGDNEVFDYNVSIESNTTKEITDEDLNKFSPLVLAFVGKNKIVSVCDVKLIQTKEVDGQMVEVEIQPSDIKEGAKVVIKMAIPESLKNKDFKVLHIHSNTEFKYVDYKVEGDYAYVTTDKLSQFAFVDMTGSKLQTWALIVLVLDCILLLLVLLGSVCVAAQNRRVMYVLFVLNFVLTALLIMTVLHIDLTSTIWYGGTLIIVLATIVFVLVSLRNARRKKEQAMLRAQYNLVDKKSKNKRKNSKNTSKSNQKAKKSTSNTKKTTSKSPATKTAKKAK